MLLKNMAISTCAAVAFWLGQPTGAQAQEMTVDVNDLLEIKAAMWNAAEGTVDELVAVSGSYTVSAGGTISVPLVGNVSVSGLTPQEIAATLQDTMAGFSGAGRAPQVAVGVESYAQIYLSGEVETPGVYEYSPGLTVLKAVTLAGGPKRVEPIQGQERNFYLAQTSARELRKELQFLEARRERLAAEVEQGEMATAESSVDQENMPSASKFRDGEVEIFNTRKDLFSQQVDYFERAETALQEAIGVLEQKLKTNNEQLQTAREELGREEEMVERGLAPRVRVFDRARYVGEVESRVLDIERSILLARQDMRELQEERLLLETKRSETTVTDLQEVRVKIAQAEAKLDGQYALMAAALGEEVTPRSLIANSAGEPAFEIVRSRGRETGRMDAQGTTQVLPGDVIEVSYPATENPSKEAAPFPEIGSLN